MPVRDIYLKIERIDDYTPVAPQDKVVAPMQYKRDCMRNTGHEDGLIPEAEVQARSLTAVVYREYLDADYLIPKIDKLIQADVNEPVYSRRVPGTVIYTKPGETLRIHVLNDDIAAHSFHLHGLDYGIDSDGAWPFGTESGDGRRSDEICPGQSWTYLFDVRSDMVGAWPFHDHAQHPGVAIDRGLFGGIVVLPKDVDPPEPVKPPKGLIDFKKDLLKRLGRDRVRAGALGAADRRDLARVWESLEELLVTDFLVPPKRRPIIHAPVFLHLMASPEKKPSFDSGDLEENGGSFSHVFGEAGSFDYFCQYHPVMTGTVEVVPGGAAAVNVNIVDGPPMAFSPQLVTVGVGGTVNWLNLSNQHHTVTALDNAAIPSHCINGRSFVGNSPTIVATAGQRIRWYVFNLELGMFWHNFHPHAQRWRFAQENIDVRSLGPAESFVVETRAPNVLLMTDEIKKLQSPRGRPKKAKQYRLKGDFLFHCHVHHHLRSGMAGLVRSKQTVWLTPKLAEEITAERGLPLDDGGNACPDIDRLRCKKQGAGEWHEVPGDPEATMMHSALLPQTSKVLFFGYDYPQYRPDYSRLWDPATDTYSMPANQPDDVTPGGYLQWSLWSSEHVFLNTPEGKLLVHGGYRSDLKKSYLFDPSSEQWSQVESTVHDRFYATTINLADGRALTLFGSPLPGPPSRFIEEYTPGTGWSAPLALPVSFDYLYYPWTYLLPDGRLFVAGPESPTRRFDPTAPADDPAQTWPTNEGTRSFGGQNGTCVLLTLRPPGYAPRAVIAGGSAAGLIDTAEIIDLSAPSPAWSWLPNLHHARGNLTGVLLPDGRVFVAGGMFPGGDGGPCEIFDPQHPADGWQLGPHMAYPRGYHSSMLLLADGSVLAGGDPGGPGGPTPHERYLPWYCFVPRPHIDAAPAAVTFGASFDIDTPQASSIAEVILMRPGAVTHGFNMSQRAVECEITGVTGSTVAATAPPHGNVAPEGWYLLFILDGDRVPSEGHWIRLTS